MPRAAFHKWTIFERGVDFSRRAIVICGTLPGQCMPAQCSRPPLCRSNRVLLLVWVPQTLTLHCSQEAQLPASNAVLKHGVPTPAVALCCFCTLADGNTAQAFIDPAELPHMQWPAWENLLQAQKWSTCGMLPLAQLRVLIDIDSGVHILATGPFHALVKHA